MPRKKSLYDPEEELTVTEFQEYMREVIRRFVDHKIDALVKNPKTTPIRKEVTTWRYELNAFLVAKEKQYSKREAENVKTKGNGATPNQKYSGAAQDYS